MTDAPPRSFMMCEIIHRRAQGPPLSRITYFSIAGVTQSAAVAASLPQGASLLFSSIDGRSEQHGESLGALGREQRT